MLLYHVHPLPDNIIEYVWDFGALTDIDTQKYITQMLKKGGISNIEMITPMLIACHKYFKKNEDSSSVSLRDIARFIKLYQWFNESLLSKKKLEHYHKTQS